MMYSHLYNLPCRRPSRSGPKPNRRDQLLAHFRHLSSFPDWFDGSRPVRAILEIKPENQHWNLGVPLSPSMIARHGWVNYTHVFTRWVHPSYLVVAAPHALGKFAKRERIAV